MCVTPRYIPSLGPVACHKCWQCETNRIHDFVGRAIAEKNHSTHTIAASLTYRPGTAHEAVLVYKDIQDFMKRLRYDGYKVRYIVAGEYGSKKGRCHWHVILFFQGKAPEIEFDKECYTWKYWKHGFAYFQEPDYAGIKYVLKYALKDQTAQVSLNHLAMSKKPPLGFDYFNQLAQDYVKQGLSPQSSVYQFLGHVDKNGKMHKFYLQGRMREIFIETYIAAYRDHHGRDYPFSEFIEFQEDKWIRQDRIFSDEEWAAIKASNVRDLGKHHHLDPDYSDWLTEEHKALIATKKVELAADVQYIPLPNKMLLVRKGDGSLTLYYGNDEQWHLENDAQLDLVLNELGVPTNTFTLPPPPNTKSAPTGR